MPDDPSPPWPKPPPGQPPADPHDPDQPADKSEPLDRLQKLIHEGDFRDRDSAVNITIGTPPPSRLNSLLPRPGRRLAGLIAAVVLGIIGALELARRLGWLG